MAGLFAATVLILIVLPALLFYIFQEKIVFSPVHSKRRQLFAEHPKRYRVVELVVHENIRLEGLVYEPEEEAGRTVLYFGGKQQDSVTMVAKLSMHYPTVRFIAFNYRGYGTSQGKPTEERLYEDALRVYDWAQSRYEKVSLMGYSLGSNIASYVASRRGVQSVILVAAFDSALALARLKFALMPKALMRCRLDTMHHVKSIKAPVYLYAATDDTIVPIGQARKIKESVQNLSRYREIGGCDHAELLFSPEMTKELSEVFEE